MDLENIVFDAADPQRLGRFWEQVLGADQLTDEPDGYETRLTVDGGPVLDLCFQRVREAAPVPQRLHLHLAGDAPHDLVVDRLLSLGASTLGAEPGPEAGSRSAPGKEPGVTLADLEGNRCTVLEERATPTGSGPLAAIVLDSADPGRDADFWEWLTGWAAMPDGEAVTRSLRHRSQRGPLLTFRPEPAAKGPAKNRIHLDVRLEAGEDPDEVAAAIADHGGRELHFDWGDLPWRHYADPSGNEFCVLRAPRSP